MSRPARLAILCDPVEEGWPSMDLVGEMLAAELERGGAGVAAELLRPALRRRLSPADATAGWRFNADRLLMRFHDYPRWLAGRVPDFDLFHLVDHSYSQLLHRLPPGRTVVTCHDLDTFRCLLEPRAEPRSAAFRAMVRHSFSGFLKATRVACPSAATRAAILDRGLFPPERVRVVANGVHPAFSGAPDALADAAAAALLGPPATRAVDLLHVGSPIARKRIDVLLRVVAAIRRELPAVRLLRAGGELVPEQRRLARELGLEGAILTLPPLDRPTLAAVYRRAAILLLPSEREGFGLPVAEALAAGTPVVASDLPVLREVGGTAATYRPVGDVAAWAEAVLALLATRRDEPAKWVALGGRGREWAARFSWTAYARTMGEIYAELPS